MLNHESYFDRMLLQPASHDLSIPAKPPAIVGSYLQAARKNTELGLHVESYLYARVQVRNR